MPQKMQENKDQLLEGIVSFLQNDERFVAAWLTGSIAKGIDDAMSDIDITVIVRNEDNYLASIPWISAPYTTVERMNIIEQFGTPFLIHENRTSPLEKGSGTHVIYQENGLQVDWIFIPLFIAQRPRQSRILFEKEPIPHSADDPIEPVKQRIPVLEERITYFWIIFYDAIKYIYRNETMHFTLLLHQLFIIAAEIEHLINADTQEIPDPEKGVYTNPQEQLDILQQLHQLAESYMQQYTKLSGYPLPSPDIILDNRLKLATSTK